MYAGEPSVKATPQPEQFTTVRFEDLVLEQESTMQRLEEFLGIRLARIVMNEARVGQWKTDGSLLPYVEPLKEAMREFGYEI